MSETTSPPQPLFHYTPSYRSPNCYVSCAIEELLFSVQQLEYLGRSSEFNSLQECPACPALSLLRLAADLIDGLDQFLDDLPATECPQAASFNLSNIRPSLPTQPGGPG